MFVGEIIEGEWDHNQITKSAKLVRQTKMTSANWGTKRLFHAFNWWAGQ